MSLGWRSTTLGELEVESKGVIQTGPFGSQLHASDYSPTGVPVIMPTNIRELRVDPSGIARISPEHVARLSRHVLNAGDIVYSRRGDVEKCALITEREAGWLCGTGCLLVRVSSENVDARFLAYALSHPDTRAWISQHAVGATMPNLNTSILREVPVRLPPIHVQRGIAATLRALDEKIDSNRRAIGLSDELIRALFARGFDAEYHDDGEPISKIVEVNPRRELRKDKIAPYVGMSALPEFSPVVMEWQHRKFGSGQRFVNGDVVMARITPCLENGKTAVIDMLDEGEVGWGSTEYIVLAPRGEISTPWVYALARSESVRSFAIRSMSGTSGRQRFQAQSLDHYRISRPRPEDLKAFNSLALPIFSRMTQLRNEVVALVELRDTLLAEFLSGRGGGFVATESVDEAIA